MSETAPFRCGAVLTGRPRRSRAARCGAVTCPRGIAADGSTNYTAPRGNGAARRDHLPTTAPPPPSLGGGAVARSQGRETFSENEGSRGWWLVDGPCRVG